MIFSGKVHLFDNNIDTDRIYPGQYLDLVKKEEVALHALEGADPDFVRNCKKGDFVIAGTNFGCGSSREYAPMSIQACGVSAIIAESFARIFFRNAMNIGLPVIVCNGIRKNTGKDDVLELDLEKCEVRNITNNSILKCEKISDFALDLIKEGKDIKEVVLKRKHNI